MDQQTGYLVDKHSKNAPQEESKASEISKIGKNWRGKLTDSKTVDLAWQFARLWEVLRQKQVSLGLTCGFLIPEE